MTTQYERAAVNATKWLTAKKYESPVDAWNDAIKKETRSPSSQDKGCPRDAYLGLCEDGMVKGVPCGEYLEKASQKNKRYAIKIAFALKANPKLAKSTKAELWKYAETDAGENEQVGVVLGLWKKGLIVYPDIQSSASPSSAKHAREG